MNTLNYKWWQEVTCLAQGLDTARWGTTFKNNQLIWDNADKWIETYKLSARLLNSIKMYGDK